MLSSLTIIYAFLFNCAQATCPFSNMTDALDHQIVVPLPTAVSLFGAKVSIVFTLLFDTLLSELKEGLSGILQLTGIDTSPLDETDPFFINRGTLLFLGFFLYFLATAVMTCCSGYFGVRGVYVLSIIYIFFFWVVQFLALSSIVIKGTTYMLYLDFFSKVSRIITFSFVLKVDFIGFSFLFLTTSIGVCAIVYALNYFKNEPHCDRFILLLNWFILSMSLLVLADNAILMFLGWELIGLTSFLLINFWTVRRGTLKAAFKAFTFNKASDIFLLFYIIVMMHITGSLSISFWVNYYLLVGPIEVPSVGISLLFLIAAAAIKSAQLFGHLWLPDSMEAPIPASALIHSATLVSAGVYLLLRFSSILLAYNMHIIVGCLGAITAVYGAVVSAGQTDCKKLLAYSTISHCGFLFVTVSINNLHLSILYLYLHGFFKALTFFSIGNLVRYNKSQQDTRKMGNLAFALPVESVLLVFSAVNLGALPYTIGYAYKHTLQEMLIQNGALIITLPFMLFAMLCSSIYVFRIIYYSLFDFSKMSESTFRGGFKSEYDDLKLSNSTILGYISIFLLFVLSVYFYQSYFAFSKELTVFMDAPVSSATSVNPNNVSNVMTACLYAYYALFSAVLFILLKVECRVEFSSLKKHYWHLYIFVMFAVGSALFLTIYSV